MEQSKSAAKVAEVGRFGLAGIASELVYFGFLWLLVSRSTVPLWCSSSVAYAGSLLVNYVLQRWFTFRSKKPHSHAGPRYLLIHAVGMGLNSGTLGLGVDVLNLPLVPCQVVAIGLVAVWSYIAQKRWAF